jgi:hypothetical protein
MIGDKALLFFFQTGFGANVTSSSLFIRWNPVTAMPEAVVVVALDTAVADVLFYRVVDGKLVSNS